MENILENAYTERDFEYIESKSLDVCIIVRNKSSKKASVKSNLPVAEVIAMLKLEEGDVVD